MKKRFLFLIGIIGVILLVKVDVNAQTMKKCTFHNQSGNWNLTLTSMDDTAGSWVLTTDSQKFSSYSFRISSNSSFNSSVNCANYSKLFYRCYNYNGASSQNKICYVAEADNYHMFPMYDNSYVEVENGSVVFNSQGSGGGSSSTTPNQNYSSGFNVSGILGTTECPAIFGNANDKNSLMGFISSYIFKPIRFLVPIVLVLLTSLDFAKAVFVGDDKDGMKKATDNFIKRSVAALIIFLAPTIVQILLSTIDWVNFSKCMSDIGSL